MTVAELADGIGRFSIILMWAALIIRARPALHGHSQRGLWLAILTAATATTLFQPEVIDWAVQVTGSTHIVTVSRNFVGILAAGLTLLFIIDSAHPRLPRLIITAALACTVTTVLGLDLAHGDYPGPTIPDDGGPATPSTAYWLLVCGSHLVADIVIVVICGRYSRHTRDRDLAWSLRLFALGSVLAAAYWAAYLTHLYIRTPEALPYLALIINLHGVSRALTLLVPTATRAVRLARDARTVWVLWPMWRDLSAAVPTIALVQPQATRLRQLLRPRSPLALQAHRQTIETYDAILHLQTHLAPQTYRQALKHAQHLQLPALRWPAAALAGALGQARRAKLADQPATGPHPLPGLDQGDTALLLAMARHWPTMSRTELGPDPLNLNTTP
jgi:hypothetical protein